MSTPFCIDAALRDRLGKVARNARVAHHSTRGAALLEAVVVIATLALLFAVGPMGYQRYESAFFRSRAEDLQRWTRALAGCGQASSLVPGAAEGQLPCNPSGVNSGAASAAAFGLPPTLFAD